MKADCSIYSDEGKPEENVLLTNELWMRSNLKCQIICSVQMATREISELVLAVEMGYQNKHEQDNRQEQ